jgi:hypothetical protein
MDGDVGDVQEPRRLRVWKKLKTLAKETDSNQLHVEVETVAGVAVGYMNVKEPIHHRWSRQWESRNAGLEEDEATTAAAADRTYRPHHMRPRAQNSRKTTPIGHAPSGLTDVQELEKKQKRMRPPHESYGTEPR